jgi:hypothetical protein
VNVAEGAQVSGEHLAEGNGSDRMRFAPGRDAQGNLRSLGVQASEDAVHTASCFIAVVGR